MTHSFGKRDSAPVFTPRPTAIAASVFVALMAQAALAQTAPSGGTLPTVTVQESADTGYAAQRSTTATKTDTPLRDTPQSISVVTKDQVADQSAQGLAEALRYVPGVGFAQGEGNRETPIFRGVATTADFFVDGVRDDVQYYRDLYNIERVEVFRGPNAMIFGRGATGGLINRVSKTANWTPSFGASLTLGSDNNRRVTADLNRPINENLSFRLNALYENSDSYRNGVHLERKGINPTLSWKLSPRTLVTFGYERFEDDRIADRGIPSLLGQGRPVVTDPSTFFGNAAGSPTWSKLDALTASVEHEFDNGVQLRNRTRWADQDKFYQNVFPGATNAAGTTVTISAYNQATQRQSLFNQTDLTFNLKSGAIQHKLLVGAEFGTQDTDNFRNTGFFGGATSVTVPVSNPIALQAVTYSQQPSDANNNSKAKVAAFYVQDQIELSPAWQLIAGLRYDRFEVDFLNKRNGATVNSTDDLISPRVGVVYKPVQELSLYANYSIAYQPRAGEQLASLVVTNAAFKPEKFKNFEVGAKWDLNPRMAATAALFRLDRTNVVILDPTDATNTRTILSDGQRTEGLELTLVGSLTPAWSMVGGYAYTDAKFVGRTGSTLRPDGAVAQVPKHTLSLWNRYNFTPAWAGAVGLIHRAKSFAANELAAAASNVELPAYTRVDAAVYYNFDARTRIQLNVENLFDKKYFINAHSNNNITPGSPRAYRVSLNKSF